MRTYRLFVLEHVCKLCKVEMSLSMFLVSGHLIVFFSE